MQVVAGGLLTDWGELLPPVTVSAIELEIRAQTLFGAAVPDQVWEKILFDEQTGCWLWLGNIHATGYGQVHDSALGRSQLVHRYMYLRLRGRIPEDRPSLDHLCRTKHCCWPGHLEPVTIAVNNQRAALARRHIKQPPLFF